MLVLTMIAGTPMHMNSRIFVLKASSPNESARLADRKSTRLNSSHSVISYAVFCLKKKDIVRIPDAVVPDAQFFIGDGGVVAVAGIDGEDDEIVAARQTLALAIQIASRVEGAEQVS